jgi:hypothetical protein
MRGLGRKFSDSKPERLGDGDDSPVRVRDTYGLCQRTLDGLISAHRATRQPVFLQFRTERDGQRSGLRVVWPAGFTRVRFGRGRVGLPVHRVQERLRRHLHAVRVPRGLTARRQPGQADRGRGDPGPELQAVSSEPGTRRDGERADAGHRRTELPHREVPSGRLDHAPGLPAQPDRAGNGAVHLDRVRVGIGEADRDQRGTVGNGKPAGCDPLAAARQRPRRGQECPSPGSPSDGVSRPTFASKNMSLCDI